MKLEGTAANMMRAFEVKLDRYEHEGHPYRARTGGIQLPAELVDSVEAVLGLDNRPQAKPHYRVHSGGASPGVSYSPPQVAQLYQFPTDVDGTGQTVAIIELGGGYTLASLTTYFSGQQINTPTVVSVLVDNATNNATNANSADGEVQLDIEVVGTIAPGAKIVVYFAPSTSQGFQDALTTAIHDTTNNPSVISISWGDAESTWTVQAMTAFDSAAQDAAALGITICAASGDDGSVAVAEPDGEVRSLGTITNREDSIRKLIKKLGPVEQLRACYEAGPTGFVLYWQLTQLGVECAVVAPTLVPTKAEGDATASPFRCLLAKAPYRERHQSVKSWGGRGQSPRRVPRPSLQARAFSHNALKVGRGIFYVGLKPG